MDSDILRQRINKARALPLEEQKKWAIEIQQLEKQLEILDKSENYIKETKTIFTDVWNFHKKYKNTISDKEWPVIIKELANIEAKHKSNKLAVDMLVAIINEFERTYKQNKKLQVTS